MIMRFLGWFMFSQIVSIGLICCLFVMLCSFFLFIRVFYLLLMWYFWLGRVVGFYGGGFLFW